MSKEKEVSICSVGDLMLCDSPLFVSVGAGTQYSKNKSGFFDNCAEHFSDADITIGNFEGCIYSPKKYTLDECQMACEEDTIKTLSEKGFNILNIANNHCLQHGVGSFFRTKEECEQNGIQPCGIKDEEPFLTDINGIRLAFLSICIHYEWYEPNDIRYENNIDHIFSKIRQIRKEDHDRVIVLSVHWGDEFSIFPSNSQIALAHRFVEYGVDIILGHHSHVFQGIEKYKDSLIVYGQGNFISDMKPKVCRETGIVKITIVENENKREIDYTLISYYINDSYTPVSYKNDWFDERQKELASALDGKFSDDEYWQRIYRNHAACHGAFTSFFKHNIFSYKLKISIKMIIDFIKRKLKKLTGKSSFGRKGSMENDIYAAIERNNEYGG